MLKLALKYSVLCGIFLISAYHLSFYFGSNPLIDIRHLLFDVFILGLFIFFAEKEFKIYQSEGILHFWQGMTIGFLVYTGATLIFFIGQFIYFNLNADAVIDYHIAATNFLENESAMYREEFGEEGYQNQLLEIQKVDAWSLVFSSSVKKLLAGFFITPVISIILRKQPK